MKNSSILFLRTIILLFGIVTLILMLWEPHLEGRNVHSTLFEIYFNDPFLAFVYIGSSPFFVALYQAYKGLGYFGFNPVPLQPIVKILRKIKYCAIVLIGCIAVAEIFIVLNSSEDRAGGVFMGILFAAGSTVIAIMAARYERKFQNALNLKPKNDLKI